jgi:hypothetical protein
MRRTICSLDLATPERPCFLSPLQIRDASWHLGGQLRDGILGQATEPSNQMIGSSKTGKSFDRFFVISAPLLPPAQIRT